MHDESLRAGERITVRKGAPLPPDGRKRLEKDCVATVVSVTGRQVKVAMTDELAGDADGSRMATPFATFDLTYVYRRG